jgi:hypothetical protein
MGERADAAREGVQRRLSGWAPTDGAGECAGGEGGRKATDRRAGTHGYSHAADAACRMLARCARTPYYATAS